MQTGQLMSIQQFSRLLPQAQFSLESHSNPNIVIQHIGAGEDAL